MSTPATPSTADSLGGYANRQQSTQPSSPADRDDMKPRFENGLSKESGENVDSIDDLEGTDSRAKALMHLLKTSSVRVPFLFASLFSILWSDILFSL